MINSGDDDDVITNYAEQVTIYGGRGDDNISNYDSLTSIFGEDGNDMITNTADWVIINAGIDDNSVTNSGSNVTIIADGGNNYIFNSSKLDSTVSNVLINTSDGKDTIIHSGRPVNVTTNSDSGYVITENGSSNVTINSGAGDDIIQNNVGGRNCNIHAGTGNDVISLYSGNEQFFYFTGEGNDTVYGYRATDTLNIIGSSISSTESGNDVIIYIDDGSITLKDYANLGAINAVDEHGQRISFNDDDSDADADADTDADIYIDLSIVREGKTGSFFVNASNTLGDDETYRSAHFQVDGNLSIPTDAVSYDDHSYYVFNDVNTDWYEAEDFAESLGGHLVIITSEGEQSVVQQMIDTLDNADAKAHYWLGATIDSDKHYRWVDGTSVNDNSYKNWAPDQPDGDDGALMMYNTVNTATGNEIGQWNDIPIDGYHETDHSQETFFGPSNFGAIVEWDNEPTTVVGTVSSDRVYSAASNSGKQAILVTDDWNVTATDRNDLIGITGNDSTIHSGDGTDSIIIGYDVSTITLADYDTLDAISFSRSIAEHSLTSREADGNLILSSTSLHLTFANKTIDDVSNQTVNNNGVSTRVADLIANVESDDRTRVKLRFWNYEYTQSESNAEDVHLDNSIVLINDDGGNEIITPDSSNVAIWANGADGNPHLSARNIDASHFNEQAILVGNALENSIVASKGGSAMWGGEGNENDTMRGGAGADDFVYLKGNGNDVIENADSNDRIWFNVAPDDISEITSNVTADGRSMYVNFKDGGSLQVNTANIDLIFSDNTTRRVVNPDDENGSRFTFWAQENGSTETTNSVVLTGDGEQNIVLTPITDADFVSINVNSDSLYSFARNIDASRFGGKSFLYGNKLENVISASSGNSTLWGGSGSADDTLIGGSGKDYFYYAKGNGNDIFDNVDANDLIRVDLPIDEFNSSYVDGIAEDSLTLKFTDGGSIKINSSANIGVAFNDGSTCYAINRGSENRQWETIMGGDNNA